MLILSLTEVARGPVRVQGEIGTSDPVWQEAGIVVRNGLRADLEARTVGEGVFVRGEIAVDVVTQCRRCLKPMVVEVRDHVDVLYEPLSEEEEVELGGEVYPLPDRGDQLDLLPALREQVLLRIPEYVVCSEKCQGLCPHCGTDLNEATCECVPETGGSPWDALKDIKFD
jgi:uncharacterized protein